MPKERLGVSPLSSLAQGHLFHASGERASPAHPANGTNPGRETAGRAEQGLQTQGVAGQGGRRPPVLFSKLVSLGEWLLSMGDLMPFPWQPV